MDSTGAASARRIPGWAVLAVVAIDAAVLIAAFIRGTSGTPVDFGAYYGAALVLRAAESPYADALAWKAAGHVTGAPGLPPTASIAYVYPPAPALAVLPLTAFPLQLAASIWLLVLFGCVLGTALSLATLLRGRRDGAFWLLLAGLVLALVAFKPIRGALTFSKQVDPLILLLLTGTAAVFARRRDGWAGVLLGLAISVKPFVVVLALLPLWKGAYRLVAVAGVVSALLVLGPLLALGLLPDFTAAAAHWGGPQMAASPVGQSVYSVLLRTLTVQPYTVPLIEAPWLVPPLQAIVGLALVGLALRVVSRRREQPLMLLLEWSLAITAMLLFGPLTEEHHLAYLAPGLAAMLGVGLTLWADSRAARGLVVLAAALVTVLMLPGTQDIAWGFYAYQDGPMPVPLSLATCLWAAVLLAALVLTVAAIRLARTVPASNYTGDTADATVIDPSARRATNRNASATHEISPSVTPRPT